MLLVAYVQPKIPEFDEVQTAGLVQIVFSKYMLQRLFIFLDLQRVLTPERLSVHARYVRRGGLDINPYRSTQPASPGNSRLVRQ